MALSLHTPIPPGSLWFATLTLRNLQATYRTTSNWSKLLRPLNNPYYQSFSQWSSHNARSLNLHTLAFRLNASTPHVVEFSLRLEHLVRGSYQPYGDDQYVTFIGEEHDGVPSYDCAGSADRRWHRTRLTCVAPTNVHVMLCLRRATSNLKITAIVRGMDVGMEESVSVVVGVRGGSTLTANASRKRKQADGINTLSLEPHASKLAALAETGDSLFNEDTAALAALPLPLPLPLSPASPATFMLTPPPPAPAVPDLSQCCCAAPPATSAGDNTGDAPACCDPSSSDMQCCATTTGTTDPATCAELCTLRMLPALGDDLGVLDWAA